MIDFGIAREFVPGENDTHTDDKTHHYAPIEQYEDRARRDAFTDVYAIV